MPSAAEIIAAPVVGLQLDEKYTIDGSLGSSTSKLLLAVFPAGSRLLKSEPPYATWL